MGSSQVPSTWPASSSVLTSSICSNSQGMHLGWEPAMVSITTTSPGYHPEGCSPTIYWETSTDPILCWPSAWPAFSLCLLALSSTVVWWSTCSANSPTWSLPFLYNQHIILLFQKFPLNLRDVPFLFASRRRTLDPVLFRPKSGGNPVVHREHRTRYGRPRPAHPARHAHGSKARDQRWNCQVWPCDLWSGRSF